ncbi:FAD-dependent monooxygenase [Kitasatospora sp. NPDC004272]
MTDTSTPAPDAAIVGLGPVGQMPALLLGRRGHDVVAVERWPSPYDLREQLQCPAAPAAGAPRPLPATGQQ